MMIKTAVKKALRKAYRWLEESESDSPGQVEEVPFDNSYQWLNASFTEEMADQTCAQRPQYLWGMLQGATLAKVLGIERVSVMEFGVASGAGLIAMEHIAERCEQRIGIKIDVFGFDTGTGHTELNDYRDLPYKLSAGFYPCDKDELQKRLRRAQMKYGLVKDTVADLVRTGNIAPVAFVGFDFQVYSATRDAMQLFSAEFARLLPRTPCSLRSTIGKDRCEYTGELLAISEFNAQHEMRKICKIPGMSYFVPPRFNGHWTQWLHTLHIFDHPLYNRPDAYKQSAIIDLNGREFFVKAGAGRKLEGATLVRGRSQ
jgi:hypothetical protein